MVVIDMTELATQNISGRVAGRSVVWCELWCHPSTQTSFSHGCVCWLVCVELNSRSEHHDQCWCWATSAVCIQTRAGMTNWWTDYQQPSWSGAAPRTVLHKTWSAALRAAVWSLNCHQTFSCMEVGSLGGNRHICPGSESRGRRGKNK